MLAVTKTGSGLAACFRSRRCSHNSWKNKRPLQSHRLKFDGVSVLVKLMNQPSLRRLEERCAELEVGPDSARSSRSSSCCCSQCHCDSMASTSHRKPLAAGRMIFATTGIGGVRRRGRLFVQTPVFVGPDGRGAM